MVTRLGVDVGGTTVKWAMLGADHEVLGSGSAPTPPGPGAVVELARGLVREGVTSIGIGLPGHVDRAAGIARFVPNPPGDWTDFPVGPQLSAGTGLPVAVVNDARAFALAELRTGAARGRSDVLFAVLGTGVGGAVALGGEILAGPRDNLGEVGHITADPSGPPCCCGNRGCVETYAAAPAIVRGLDGFATAAAVAAAARSGDREAAAAMSRAGRALGVALGDAAALLGIGTIVVGGGVAGALDLMLSAMRDEFERRRPLIGDVTVSPAALGPWAGAIGAALYGGEPQ
ncbi:ROK family protein [Nonomuraea sp. KC401]|uniref:ROK family protein n=1 Tax=Nonomuraea longispora TaxID=1848320 RepID=A0A4R4N4G9_9ACTN|nr:MULTISPECIES: ROK family protein [Nonomuraea]NBE99467.1 ROK family protein [Nonomuraea sp. K271]TDC01112.1 ROK family protein [Nonomuraea longispora]TLF58542.1 ROK family protein [Nonomuraea sp. KC401]